MISLKKVFWWNRAVRIIKGIDNDKFDFHARGQNAFNVNAGLLPRQYALFDFGQPGQIRRQLDKNSIGLGGADDPRHGFARVEQGDVFLPGAEQLLLGKGNAVPLNRFDDGANIHPHGKPLSGVVDARNGNRVDRQQ